MIIDASKIDYEELNVSLSREKDELIILENVTGQRFLGSGAKNKQITVNGTAGNALGAFLSASNITVNGDVGDALGDSMLSGCITIHGKAGDSAGYSMCGGDIFVRDSVGLRAGMGMKSSVGSVSNLVIGNTAGDFAGDHLSGGIIVVLGLGETQSATLVGSNCGTWMTGGKIYIRGNAIPNDLPDTLQVTENADITDILPLLSNFCVAFSSDEKLLTSSKYICITAKQPCINN